MVLLSGRRSRPPDPLRSRPGCHVDRCGVAAIVAAVSVTCAGCGEVMRDGSRYCASCGAPLASPPGSERKLATIVFADLVGSTTLVAGRDPEDARTTLAPFIELARSTFEEHGGRVEKYIGDAVMAVF